MKYMQLRDWLWVPTLNAGCVSILMLMDYKEEKKHMQIWKTAVKGGVGCIQGQSSFSLKDLGKS